MAFRTWGRVLLVALGVGVLAGAGQLGFAYGFGIVRFARTFDSTTASHWTAQLTWVSWFTMVAGVVGAVIADRLARRYDYRPTVATRAALAGAAALGAGAVAPLSMQPARAAEVASVDPVLATGLVATLGAVVGLVAALAALNWSPISWNIALLTGGIWLLALISVMPSLGPTDPLPAVRLGVPDPAWLGAGTTQRLAVVTMAALALVAGAISGAVARFRKHPTSVVASTGAVGPALLALAYLSAGTGGSADKYQAAPYWGALVAVGAGALGSVLAAVMRWPLTAETARPTPLEPTEILRRVHEEQPVRDSGPAETTTAPPPGVRADRPTDAWATHPTETWTAPAASGTADDQPVIPTSIPGQRRPSEQTTRPTSPAAPTTSADIGTPSVNPPKAAPPSATAQPPATSPTTETPPTSPVRSTTDPTRTATGPAPFAPEPIPTRTTTGPIPSTPEPIRRVTESASSTEPVVPPARSSDRRPEPEWADPTLATPATGDYWPSTVDPRKPFEERTDSGWDAFAAASRPDGGGTGSGSSGTGSGSGGAGSGSTPERPGPTGRDVDSNGDGGRTTSPRPVASAEPFATPEPISTAKPVRAPEPVGTGKRATPPEPISTPRRVTPTEPAPTTSSRLTPPQPVTPTMATPPEPGRAARKPSEPSVPEATYRVPEQATSARGSEQDAPAASTEPSPDSPLAAPSETKSARPRRGLFRRNRAASGDDESGPATSTDAAPTEPPAQREPRGRGRTERAVPEKDEEYVDWVSGLGAPSPGEDAPRDDAPRRTLRSTGRHHAD
ncbi:hypothetical protein ACI2K4_12595 [Micromonospora sp. NPDC050397]|uniref:hypothetical protein n=1 Tax=Micromonospora sp. NPDC050397 TaxID=3364279 RepID=UPI00384EC2F4